jgi:hypothetical protein
VSGATKWINLSSSEHKDVFQERNVKAEMNFIKNLPFSYLERVFSIKALPYSFFPQEECLSEKERGKICVGFKNNAYFWRELFDSIAPQNAEIRTVTNSLPLKSENSAKSLFFNRLYQTDENLK